MRFNQRSAKPAFIATGLVAAVVGLTATSMAMAASTKNETAPSKTVSTKAVNKAGTNTMSSRMAPTQNTKGTGANPEANTAPTTGSAKAMKKMPNDKMKGDSNMPRMAPTQNTKATGTNPKAND
ncbi:hypothetical protein [Salinisphaera hydrothermalis]|uniref:Pentapeptide MXKDX repeat protein n=1 Tax=Salinisphaera hydrothermalis (strain C41B8) TaxID=1304275 RepID=A0A084IKT9_SALHC|nr:hypothetical protein [Salinisphaera hydrothermalis]KEZ77323.1 hypothetical protein C41B8_10695 [Salinisphaera hydrothermalis C41B8]